MQLSLAESASWSHSQQLGASGTVGYIPDVWRATVLPRRSTVGDWGAFELPLQAQREKERRDAEDEVEAVEVREIAIRQNICCVHTRPDEEVHRCAYHASDAVNLGSI